MPNTRELRRRIRSVKNISQITKAMQMVAATKMRKAQNQALSGRPYNLTINEAMTLLLPRIQDNKHPLLHERTVGNTAILLLSTDKTLCGSLNTNLFRATLNFLNTNRHPRPDRGSVITKNETADSRVRGNDVVFYTVGRQGRQFVVKTGNNLIADFENSDLVHFRLASQIAKLVTQSFLEGEIKELYVMYPNFVSALKQEPKMVRILPVDYKNLIETLSPELANKKTTTPESPTSNPTGEFLFEPNLDDLLEFVLAHFVQIKIYQAMLETKASEHSARMLAMQNATDNAKELVTDLTLAYNQTRQAAITNELLEITSAQAALE